MNKIDNEKTILALKKGDVNGDGINDIVYLIGNKNVDNSPFITNISILIKDGKTNEVYEIVLKENVGYNPTLYLYNFTNQNMDDIFVAIDSGGSGGFGYFYIYSFKDNQALKVFDFESFSSKYNYVVIYKDNYLVEVKNNTLKKSFLIDISGRDKDYLNSIYYPNGKLIKNINGLVGDLNNLYPVDIDRNGIEELYALQRVTGLYNADSLGVLETPLIFKDGSFVIFNDNQTLSIYETDYNK